MSSFLPRRNPLPQLTPANVRRLQEIVAEQVWAKACRVDVWRSAEQHAPLRYEDAIVLPLEKLEPGTFFGRGGDQWTTFWMKLAIPAADKAANGRRYLRWNCQGETTVWLDGQPWAGLDMGHQECPLPDRTVDCWLECCSWQTGIWISMLGQQGIGEHGILFDGAEVVHRVAAAWQCHCDLDAIVQIMETALASEPDLKLVPAMGYCRALESASPRLRRLLHDLEELCDSWHVAHDLGVLQAACQDFMRSWPAESWQPRAAVCGHAHIDLVWLWPESATRKKIIHSFATVLRLLETYPEMIYVQSMPAVYRIVEQECPEMMSQIVSYIEAGRWEALGGFEVEPDTNLPGGEALLRSIVVGQRKLIELTGKPSEVAWIPDVFGYSQCLPQIMALAGVRFFYTTKLTWSKVTKFPYTSFVWRGADGTETLAHLGTTDYNGEVVLAVHEQAFAQHRQAGLHPELLLPTGYGDGGGGPTELHAERVRRFASLSGAPRTEWTRVDDFFARLEPIKDQLPVYQGELYLEYHRGTYTTQSEVKRLYRRAERALQLHEAVRVVHSEAPLPEDHWLRLLWVQFHDALPGSSIEVVNQQLRTELAAIGDREAQLAVERLESSSSPDVEQRLEKCAFNSLPFSRLANIDDDGRPRQIRLPPLGATPVEQESQVLCPILEADNRVLRHERLTARFDLQGQLTELAVDGRSLEFTNTPGFALSPDDPAAFDAWDIDHHTVKLAEAAAERLQLELKQHAAECAVLESTPVAVGDRSEATIRYVLEAGSTHLRIELLVNWQESHRLLRYVVPTSYRGRMAWFGCPFGAIERPQLSGDEAVEAQWEVPGARWAAVQHDGGDDGLAILAESKLGYGARDGALWLSLLRSSKYPDKNADQGPHNLAFALGRLRRETSERDLSTSMAADALFSPPLIYRGPPMPRLFAWEKLGTLNPAWCAPSAEVSNAYYVRLHETSGAPGFAVLNLAHAVARAELVNALEEPIEALPIIDNSVKIPYRPWQILTLRIERSGG